MMPRLLIVISTLTILRIGLVSSRSSGPPAETATCANLIPSSSAPHVLQSGSGTYVLTINIPASNDSQYLSYTAGTEYTGTISADAGNNIRGFLITAENPSSARIGSFTPQTGQQLLDCNAINSVPAAATLVHSTPNTAPTVSFTWTAPSGADGMVRFRYTIVRSRPEYFGPLASAMSSLSATTMSSLSATTMSTPMSSTTMSPMSTNMNNIRTDGSTNGARPGDSTTRAGASTLSASIILGALMITSTSLL